MIVLAVAVGFVWWLAGRSAVPLAARIAVLAGVVVVVPVMVHVLESTSRNGSDE